MKKERRKFSAAFKAEVGSPAPDHNFDVEHFNYSKQNDEYTCPAGKKLSTNGRCYNKASGKTMNRVKHYKTKACLSCPLFSRCTTIKKGRLIERSEHMDLIDANKIRLQENPDLYRRRQAIVEHPFGVIKRQWDFYYIMTKRSIQHASADVGMIFTDYYLRRTFNILDKNLLKAYLKALGSAFSFYQRSFKAIFEHSVGLGLATCTDTLLGLKSNKWYIFERYIYLIGGY